MVNRRVFNLHGKKIGIIGGSGSLGSALAHRLIKESFEVIIGSRSPEKGVSKIGKIDKDLGVQNLKIQGIVQTASESELIFLTVPFSAHHKPVSIGLYLIFLNQLESLFV